MVAADAQPRWPLGRSCERGKRGHHQTPFVGCTTGTIQNLLNHRAASPPDRGDFRGRKGVRVILQQSDCAWGAPAHPSPSTADLAALHAKANWLTVRVAGPSIAAVAPRYHHGLPRARILVAQQKATCSKAPGSAEQCTAIEQ